MKLRELAQSLVNTIQGVMLNFEKELANIADLNDGIPFAKLAVSLKKEIETLHGLVAAWTQPLLSAPARKEGENKLLVLKRTVSISFDNVKSTVSGLRVGISRTDDLQQLVSFVQGLKTIYGLLQQKF